MVAAANQFADGGIHDTSRQGCQRQHGDRGKGNFSIHWFCSLSFTIRGNARAALDEWQRAIAAARQANLRNVEYRCQSNIGIVLYQQGD